MTELHNVKTPHRLLINAVSTRPGGGLMVYEALLRGLLAGPQQYFIFILVHNSDTYDQLFDIYGNNTGVQILRTPGWLGRACVIFQPLLVKYFRWATKSTVVMSQNTYLEWLPVSQIVYHVNMFNFIPNEALTTRIDRIKQFVRHRSARQALSQAALNVFESNYIATLASNKKVGPTIYIGTDEQFHIDSLPAESTAKSSPHLVLVSNQHPHKRNEMAIDCLHKLVDSQPDVDWKIHVFGGLDQSVWEPLIQYAGTLANRLQFHGYKNREEICNVMDSSLCLINTSKTESFCSVALEAMARGLPCVVTPHSAMPESVGTAGYVATTDSVQEITTEITNLWFDQEYRNERRISSLEWAKKYSWQNAANSFDVHINKLMKLDYQND